MYIVGEEEIDALARIIRSGALFRYRDRQRMRALRERATPKTSGSSISP